MIKNSIKYLMIILFSIGVSSCKNPSATANTAPVPIQVKATAVQKNDIKEYLTFNGVTQFQKKENIRANLTGYISWLPFEVGSTIRSGQTFAMVRTKEQDALTEAIKIDSSLAKFSAPIRIYSNATGVITILNVVKNDYVAEGDVLATVAQPRTLTVQVNIPYEYEDNIDIGTPCEIILQNEKAIFANITGILPVINPIAQSQNFLIALPDEDLPENLNVQVRTIYKENKNAISVPHEALQTNELLTDFWVMKVVNDTLAIKEKVVPLLRNDSLVQIQSANLQLNDMVVTEGSYQMQDSTLVSIQKQ
ncbi:efflux RND transporter periplasmic adaptor subunit [Arenibacter sp. NBRC 103722]|uniref:efflux RND transporter periplasmic adaptor subunit n=1 Tax=Arenibacter sp. NBRC 103722 TaxID=1113929 RepID=UPI0008539491|nr:HlyD family efflux transporter periplasmic adaptor subunit [Arenibacter sp. NBRC 103722]MDX1766441.1 HlyD family efflux transporter periplasmic adaptor subunit [Arenibacter troitsensis]|tara:strand:+ start:737 stop:1657 length:921 start_codon:yes stop_codon:yes gene_type:complete